MGKVYHSCNNVVQLFKKKNVVFSPKVYSGVVSALIVSGLSLGTCLGSFARWELWSIRGDVSLKAYKSSALHSRCLSLSYNECCLLGPYAGTSRAGA